MDVKLASSDAVLADHPPAAERRDVAVAGAAAGDRSVFVTTAPWRAQALRGIGYATGTLTLLWLVALIAGAVGAGRLPAVPFPAIGHLGTHARVQPAVRAPSRATTFGGSARSSRLVDSGRATGRGLRDGSPGSRTLPQRRIAPRDGARTTPDGARLPAPSVRQPAASPPASALAPPSPGTPQPSGSAPRTASPAPPAAGGGTGKSVTPASDRGAASGTTAAPASGRAAGPPTTTPGTVHRPTTTG